MKSNYHEDYTWAMDAVKLLSSTIPPKLTIDVLRQASKSCVVKREFSKAELLVKQAVSTPLTSYSFSVPARQMMTVTQSGSLKFKEGSPHSMSSEGAFQK